MAKKYHGLIPPQSADLLREYFLEGPINHFVDPCSLQEHHPLQAHYLKYFQNNRSRFSLNYFVLGAQYPIAPSTPEF